MTQVEACTRCGAELEPGFKFCGSCGAPVQHAPEPSAPADPYVTFIGAPVVPEASADADAGTPADQPAAHSPVAPTVIGIRRIRLDEVTTPQPDPEPAAEAPPERAPLAPTVIGMPAISMPAPPEASDSPTTDAAADPLGAEEPDVDPELEAEVEAMRAAARASEAEARRQAEAEAEAEAQRQAELEADRLQAEIEAQQRQAEAEARRQAELEAERLQAEVEAQRQLEEQRQAEAELERAVEDVPEPEAPVELVEEPIADLFSTPVAGYEDEPAVAAAAVTDDEGLGEALPPYAVFRAQVELLDDLIHLAANDPGGRAADTLRRSGFVLLWTAFDAFVRDTLATLAERHPAALLAAADEGAAVTIDELLAMSDGLASLDRLRAGLAARELDRLRGRLRSVGGTIDLLATTFRFVDAPLPAPYLVAEESRTLVADAVAALETRRDGLVHGDGEPVTSDELGDAGAALAALARRIAESVASGRYGAPDGVAKRPSSG